MLALLALPSRDARWQQQCCPAAAAGWRTSAKACVLQVGAQNAGKSSLINAMRRAVQRDAARRTSLTVAALPGLPQPRLCTRPCLMHAWISGAALCRLWPAAPGCPAALGWRAPLSLPEPWQRAGTTLSVLRVDGLMGQGCRMFDSPGVPHAHQLTAQLTLPEVGVGTRG